MLERGGGEERTRALVARAELLGELAEIELDEGPVEIMMSYLQK